MIGAPTNLNDFRRFAETGPVDAVISDSTNAMRDGQSPTEAEVGQGIATIVREANTRVAVTLFSSNMARVKSILDAARNADRTVVVAGRALQRVITVGTELGLLTDLPDMADMRSFDSIPRDQVLVLLTGSQGEERAALARISQHEHPHISLVRGDKVIFSSRIIPGNEKGVLKIMNALAQSGVELITDTDARVHVSGHPRRGELLALYHALKPRCVIPVHGEARHLSAHADLVREAGYEAVIVGNGDRVAIDEEGAHITDEVESGVYVKDGDLVMRPEASGVFERVTLGTNGLVSIALAVDGSGRRVGDVEVIVDGLPDMLGRDETEGYALDAAIKAFDATSRSLRRDPDGLADAMRKSVRSAIGTIWGKRPICHVHVLLIED